MRYALAFLLFTGAAHASAAEDFKACLIGYSVMALDAGAVSADAAQADAAARCPLPDDPNDEIDVDAISADVHVMVERMAAE